jgi:hypothetical protein
MNQQNKDPKYELKFVEVEIIKDNDEKLKELLSKLDIVLEKIKTRKIAS